MKKKFITMALVAGMVVSMAACGNKEASESSVASGNTSESSVVASSETENASKEQIILNDVIDDIKNAGTLHKGDETNRILFDGGREEDDEFTFDGTATFLDRGTYWYETDVSSIYALTSKPDEGVRFTAENSDAVVGAEGSYRYFHDTTVNEKDYDNVPEYYFCFQSDCAEGGKYYEIRLEVLKGERDVEKHAAEFLNIVKGFVASGLGSSTEMSNVSFDPTIESEFGYTGGFVIQ